MYHDRALNRSTVSRCMTVCSTKSNDILEVIFCRDFHWFIVAQNEWPTPKNYNWNVITVSLLSLWSSTTREYDETILNRNIRNVTTEWLNKWEHTLNVMFLFLSFSSCLFFPFFLVFGVWYSFHSIFTYDVNTKASER